MDIRYSKTKERPAAEIVKEQFSLAINKAAGEYDRNLTDIKLYAGDEYKVKHNGSEYNCVAWEENGKVHIGGQSEPFDIYNFAGDIYVKAETDGANTFEVHHEKVNTFDYDVMPKGYPGVKTEMVEIEPGVFEEQEIVKPIDPKFVGGVTVYTYNNDYLYHYDIETRKSGEKVTKKELNTAFSKGLIYVTNRAKGSIDDTIDVLLIPIAGFNSNIAEYGEICFINPESNELIWKQTSEYEASGGGAPV